MKLYKYNVNDFTDDVYLLAYNNLAPDKKARVDKLRRVQDKKLIVAGDMLLKQALKDLGVGEIVISKNPKGKPYIENSPYFFNISHSGNFCVCVISDREIGIDIEKIRDIRLKTANKFATENEFKYILGGKDVTTTFLDENYEVFERFFEIWTLKEAYFKMLGTGISDNLKSVEFEISGNKAICNKNCSLLLDKSINGYIISIAE